MKRRKYILLYGLFVLCFTKVFYILLDGIVRGDKEYFVTNPVVFEKWNSESNSGLNIMARNDKRLERIAEVCKKFEPNTGNNRTPSVLSEFHFYNRLNICACHVPKAASTSIGRALLISEYPEKADIIRSIPGHRLHVLKHVENVTSGQCFRNPAKSFFVTRDPYQRLYSAYIDKVYLQKFHMLAVILHAFHNEGLLKENLKEMIENKDKRLNKLFCANAEVSFELFLKYVTTTEKLDSHFAPVSLICDPCSRHYHKIVRQETLKEDLGHLFEGIYKTKPGEIPVLQNYTGESGVESQILTYYIHWRAWLKKHKCNLDKQFYNEINRRLWNGLKLLGSIDENLEFIDELFREPVGTRTKLTVRDPESVLYEFKVNKVPFLDADKRENQRRRYLAQAYKNVDKAVIRKVQQLFHLDFILFDYNPDPPI